MGVLCNTCQGSGRLASLTTSGISTTATACGYCQGLGYRDWDRRAGALEAPEEVAKILEYDQTLGSIQVRVEETLHRGDRLLAKCCDAVVEFEAKTLTAAGMQLEMALRGWLVNILVPQALPAGAWIMRHSTSH
ncbi:MAG: hypothetical protein U0176_01090 [Bacteroidia bacterium]